MTDEIKNEFDRKPKLVTIFRQIAAYEVKHDKGDIRYELLYRKSMNGAWIRMTIEPKEIATLVVSKLSWVRDQVTALYPNFEIAQMESPLSIEALDVQLKRFGKGWCCEWLPCLIDGKVVGLQNEKLNTIALYCNEEINLRLLPSIEAEYGGFRYEGLVEGHKFARVGPSEFGAGKHFIDSEEEAAEVASQLIEFGKIRHEREIRF
ncbi:hypothetical protein [Vibrio mediterranei]|uniref:hypothetical protein n=1 Tax=Vibrio mediterranei TaxID=689 RepID=UPI00406778B9